MRLVGARKFLETVKEGTLCVEFWKNTQEECSRIIEDYKKGEDIIQKYKGEFYIFGDNSGSLGFIEDDIEDEIDGKKYNCLCYYDKNIVGDACPKTTLQLVFETEDEYPEEIYIESEKLTKEDIIKIKNWFVKNTLFSKPDDWVWEFLNKEKENTIINFDSEEDKNGN